MASALILSCSRSKRPDQGPISALDRYDGPAFRVLRCYLRETPETDITTKIISAEFGLIDAAHEIGCYDRQMTPTRAAQLRPEVTTGLEQMLFTTTFDRLMIWASELYLATMEEALERLPAGTQIAVPTGSIGRRVSELREWLREDQDDPPPPPTTGHATIRGVQLVLSPEDVIDAARREISRSAPLAQRFETWCVDVDGVAVAPKWLISILTELPVSAFRTADAISALRKLGIEVIRCRRRATRED